MHMPNAAPRGARLTMLLATLWVALATAPAVRAQTWTETGDAGQLVGTAQSTIGTGSLFSIDGSLASATDVDLYCIRMTSVPPANLPLVRLQCVVNQGPNVWLFDATGKGVFTNFTCSGGDKTILAPSSSLAPGIYYVGVSYFGLDPQASAGAIWQPALGGQRAPDGPGATGTLTGWAGTPNVQPINPYHLSLAFMTFCDAPTPNARATWGSLKSFYR